MKSRRMPSMASIGQQMKWGGGRYDVTWDTTRLESTNIFSTFNPSFGANMTLQYTQPLLRGFRTDSRRTATGRLAHQPGRPGADRRLLKELIVGGIGALRLDGQRQ